MSNYTSAESIAAMAMESLGIDDSRDEIVFKSWIYMGEKQMGCYKTLEEVCLIKNENNRIKKPCDFVSPIEIRFKTIGGDIWGYTCSGKGNFTFKAKGDTANGTVNIYEDEYFFHLGSQGDGIESAELHYYKLPLTEDGEPLIPQKHEYALLTFLRYMYYAREMRNVPRYESFAMNLHQMWKNEMIAVKGNEKMPSMLEGRDIMLRWQTMLPAVIRKRLR